MHQPISVVTSNVGKLREISQILGDSVEIVGICIDLTEPQGTAEDIAVAKCLAASLKVEGPVIVDDSSLSFNAFGDLPGPYIKYFLDRLQPQGLHRLLTGFEDKTAIAKCVIAYCPRQGEKVMTFAGEVKGKIVEPRGIHYQRGWYPCFQPDDSSRTYGEMTDEEINKTSHRSRALQQLRDYLTAGQHLASAASLCSDS